MQKGVVLPCARMWMCADTCRHAPNENAKARKQASLVSIRVRACVTCACAHETQAVVYTHAREKHAHLRGGARTHLRTYMSIAHPRDPVPPIEVRDDGARLSADQSWSKLSLWCFAGLVFNYVWDRYSGLRGSLSPSFAQHSVLSLSLSLSLSISPFRFSLPVRFPHLPFSARFGHD